jgi:hypothetical protein
LAQFQKDFYQDLNQDVKIRQCGTIVFTGDNKSNIITVSLFNGQEPAPQTGSVACYVIRSDGKTVPTITGSISGNVVSATLTEACFTRTGPIGVGIQVIDGTVKTTVLKAVYNVETLYTDDVIDPSGEITLSVGDLVQRIDNAVASIPADYSDLLAAIAPDYTDLTFPVTAGTWCWYSGSLHQATVDIPASESWTASHWASIPLSNGLKNAVDTLADETELYAFQLRRAAVIEKALVKNWVKGAFGSSTGVPTTGWDTRGIYTPDYYLVSPGMEIRFTGNTTGKGGETLNHYAYFYDAKKNMTGSRSNKVPYTIPEDAYYVRFAYAFAASAGQTLDGYGGIDAVVAEWNVESVSAIEKALQGGAASLQSVQPLSSPQSIQALDADGGENE